MSALKLRQREILAALSELGGQATTNQIAEKAGLHPNGVSQSLGALVGTHVQLVGTEGGRSVWKLLVRAP